ncbi:hypothetical protein [Desulfoplanes formicivorans]|uniref:Uncharacterized protein n=1 Tax=Desulfoplanes formicivorans TaxID=1592317 RepID=A0A194ADV9_9BACT|nr:hypothetical protein [Desulfoplanes formicivorans]GAU08262.1 hypothetical protein DPF_0965 [Desulfoplanes formicivorans]
MSTGPSKLEPAATAHLRAVKSLYQFHQYVLGEFFMKICAISPFELASKHEIIAFIKKINHDLVILPGNSSNHPTIKEIQKNINSITKVFVEIGNGKLASTPCLVSKMNVIKMPSQLFAQNPTSHDVDNLVSIWSKRTIKVNGKQISFAICGEIDAFHKDGYVKYNQNLPFEILINPTHTIRGRWNHLGPKLSNLSKGTVVVHVANNDRNHHCLSTNVRIYEDSQLCPQYQSVNLSWAECKI